MNRANFLRFVLVCFTVYSQRLISVAAYFGLSQKLDKTYLFLV